MISDRETIYQVFTAAASDDHKSIVLLAFEIIEKIIRDYFPYITETETTTFTDCVNCLIAFTNNKTDKDISLSAISFLRFCAAKLAEGDLASSSISPRQQGKDGKYDRAELSDKEDHLYFWFPLLAGEKNNPFGSNYFPSYYFNLSPNNCPPLKINMYNILSFPFYP